MKKVFALIVLVCLFTLGALANTPIAADNFTRNNSTTLGSNWTLTGGQWGISSNQAIFNSGTGTDNSNAVYWNAATFDNDQYSKIKVYTNFSAGYKDGTAVRIQSGVKNYYKAYCNLVSSGRCTSVVIVKVLANVNTTLAAFSSLSLTGGGYLMLSATGSTPTTLKVFYNGVQIGTDFLDSSSPITGGKPGLATAAGSSAWSSPYGIYYWEGGNVNSNDVLRPSSTGTCNTNGSGTCYSLSSSWDNNLLSYGVVYSDGTDNGSLNGLGMVNTAATTVQGFGPALHTYSSLTLMYKCGFASYSGSYGAEGSAYIYGSYSGGSIALNCDGLIHAAPLIATADPSTIVIGMDTSGQDDSGTYIGEITPGDPGHGSVTLYELWVEGVPSGSGSRRRYISMN